MSNENFNQLPPGLQRLYREILDDEAKGTLAFRDSSRSKQYRLSQLVLEYMKREQESLALYEPLPHVAEFHSCEAPERILRGSNRSGKTLTAACEFSRAVTGTDPFKKYPKNDGRAFVVGKDEKHNSEVLYRKLFRPGAFYVIQDKATGKMRSFRPWEPEDAARKDEARRADPLIPPRMIVDIAWENKKESCPSLVTLTNGWEIRFFSSKGKPPQGSDIDLAWFDEEIVDSEWYNEIAARLIDRDGKFFWSATAQLGGAQLFDLCEQAERCRNDPEPRVVEVFAHISSNPHFTDEQREKFFSKLTDEQIKIRVEGEFAFTSYRVYPEFEERVQGIDYFQIPNTWTRYAVTDPGRQVCAVIFAAVPPPSDPWAGHVIAYDELYIRNCTAKKYGEEMRKKCQGQNFEAFIIDHQGGKITDIASGQNVEAQYAAALKQHRIRSRRTGHAFIWGASDVDGGIEKTRSWLVIGDNGRSKFLFFASKMPNFAWEVKRYHYKRVAGRLTDKPDKRNDHMADNLRYLAMYDPKWVKPVKMGGTRQGVLDRIKEKKKKNSKPGSITLGPSSRASA